MMWLLAVFNLAAPQPGGYPHIMSVATLQQFGQNLPQWMALVMRGESVAIVDGGKEVARLMPPAAPTSTVNGAQPAAGEDWRKTRLAELKETFPESVIGASAEMEAFRAERL